MGAFSLLRPCLAPLNRSPLSQTSLLLIRRFSDDNNDDFKQIKSSFDDGLFHMKYGDKQLILSYWTPLRRVTKCLVKDDDDRKNIALLDGDQKIKLDETTPLGAAFQATEKIVLKTDNKSLLLSLDGSQSSLKKWAKGFEVVKSEPVDELEKKKNLLLQSYVPMLQSFERILDESHTSSALRFKWIGLFGMSSLLGFMGRLIWYEYSWDIMEPITWCITYSITVLTFSYYVVTSQEYQYPQAERRMAIKRFCKSYGKKQFDLNSFTKLHQQVKFLDQQIREMKKQKTAVL